MSTLEKMKIKAEQFPLKEARELARDLMTPNPTIYWLDFLSSMLIGVVAFAVTVVSETYSLTSFVAYLVTVLALYRAVIFIHDIVHFKKNTMKHFELAWNILCGFFVMVPSYMYQGVHMDHHKQNIYGTTLDGEYLPFGAQNPWKNVVYVITAVILPVSIAIRYLILAPLSWFIPSLARLVWQRASSLTIDLDYRRPPHTERDGNYWRVQEVCASTYGWTAVVLGYYGVLPMKFFAVWYAVLFLILMMNSVRTLGAHAYRNPGDETMTVAEQFLDSVDVPGSFLSALWAPVGLRYHATHHLFPRMPYHSLATAYNRLKKDLPRAEIYLESTRPTLFRAMISLWKDASQSQKKN